jgi:hypothetical protein
MKRLALVAAIFAVTACAKGEETPATDTTTPAMAPAPLTDSQKMADSMKMDSMKMDTTAKKP